MEPLIVQKLLLVHFYQVLIKDQVFIGTILIRPLADDKINQKFYFFAAFFTRTASITSNMALLWIDYPTQVIAKGKKK